MNVDFGWRHATLDIPDNGLPVERRATPDQLAALAASLGVTAIRDLTARYTIRAGRKGRYIVQGELAATIEQACVVTFDPVISKIREPLDVEFWPPEQLDAKPVHAEEAEAARSICRRPSRSSSSVSTSAASSSRRWRYRSTRIRVPLMPHSNEPQREPMQPRHR